MEIGEDDLAAPQHGDLARLRLLDFHNHVGTGEDLGRAADHLGPSLLIILIRQAGA